MEAFQALFGFAQIPGGLNRLPVRVGREGLHPDINADLFPCGFMCHLPLSLDGKLHVGAIGPLDQPDPLDLVDGRGFNLSLLANQAHGADAAAEGVV